MNEQGVESLSNGIVLQACKDYRSALAGNKVNGKPPDWVISECESFFFLPLVHDFNQARPPLPCN